MSDRRQSAAGVFAHDDIVISGDELRWWTFAGGRINSTLRHALQTLHPDWTIIADNFLLRLRGSNLSKVHFAATLRRIQESAFWKDSSFWKTVTASLPAYRLTKFQPLMPHWIEQEIIANFLLELAETQDFLRLRIRIHDTVPKFDENTSTPLSVISKS